jgi:hypothetical protein
VAQVQAIGIKEQHRTQELWHLVLDEAAGAT